MAAEAKLHLAFPDVSPSDTRCVVKDPPPSFFPVQTESFGLTGKVMGKGVSRVTSKCSRIIIFESSVATLEVAAIYLLLP